MYQHCTSSVSTQGPSGKGPPSFTASHSLTSLEPLSSYAHLKYQPLGPITPQISDHVISSGCNDSYVFVSARAELCHWDGLAQSGAMYVFNAWNITYPGSCLATSAGDDGYNAYAVCPHLTASRYLMSPCLFLGQALKNPPEIIVANR